MMLWRTFTPHDHNSIDHDADFEQRIARWLEANGETDWIALKPVRVRFGWAHYSTWPRDRDKDWPETPIPTKRRITIPLRRIR